MSEELKDEAKENIQVEVNEPSKKEEGSADSAPEQSMLLDPEALQQIVLQSGVLDVILEAVKIAGVGISQGMPHCHESSASSSFTVLLDP